MSYMREYEKLTDLTGDIYDAALEPTLWTGVIAEITDFVGGQAGGLISKTWKANSEMPTIIAASILTPFSFTWRPILNSIPSRPCLVLDRS